MDENCGYSHYGDYKYDVYEDCKDYFDFKDHKDHKDSVKISEHEKPQGSPYIQLCVSSSIMVASYVLTACANKTMF